MRIVPRLFRLAAVCAFVGAAAVSALAAPSADGTACRKVVNVVNFIRTLDPRIPREEAKRIVREEIALCRRYGFPNTIPLQYDALLDAEYLALVRPEKDNPNVEFGFWFELCRAFVERCGMTWRGRPGWEWDWYIDPGFLMAYTQEERRRLVDEGMRAFKAEFGHYPKVVGSWLLDAYSMDYMATKYGVDAFPICREQDSTDAYGLRGGYSNGIYYPSKRNMLSAARERANAVGSPVFKILTPDPIYNYSRPDWFYADFPFKQNNCPTLEPVWPSGHTPRIIDWYLRKYLDEPGLLNVSYMQVGQENFFGWDNLRAGLEYQFAKLDELRRTGRVTIEKMGETAAWFKRTHPVNCPQTQVALDDWAGTGRKSVWYNCARYRANLYLYKDRLYFRDIHVMDDHYAEPFLDRVCRGKIALYYTPPIVDEYLFRTNGLSGMMAFDGRFERLEVAGAGTDGLSVTCWRTDGSSAKVSFAPEGLTVTGSSLDFECPESFRETFSFADGNWGLRFDGYRYAIGFSGTAQKTERGVRFVPESGKIRFDP